MVFIIAAYVYFSGGIQSGVQIDKKTYPITGIDISDQTGKVNAEIRLPDSIKFVIIKASQGKDYVDKQFEANYQWAKAQNVKIGAYHFLSFRKDAKDQASNFLNQIKDKKFTLPLVLDVESWLNPTSKSDAEITAIIREFLDIVLAKTGNKMMIYSNESDYKKYIENKFAENEIWICSFNNPPKTTGKWTFWQYSHQGKFDFAPGWVDINTFNGNEKDWNNYILK
jgi:lysozyme